MKEELLKQLIIGEKQERKLAAEELANYPEEQVIEALVSCLASEPLKSIKITCAESLKTINQPLVAKKIVNLLNHRDERVRLLAQEVLIFLKDKAIPYLSPLLKNSDYNIRKYALDVLAAIKSPKALSLILPLTSDPEPNVRYTAVEYLALFPKKNPEVSKTLKQILSTANEPYGLATLVQVIKIRKEKSLIPLLKQRLRQIDDNFIKFWLYKALLYLKEKGIFVEALNNALEIKAHEDILKDILILEEKIPKEVINWIKKKNIKIKDPTLQRVLEC
ncbi:MAG TPA: HEAT repeat domain-containing protein [Candidatus Desulfofervidus auxilii]|uniref:HEAT repeat domain-containing protein n=1 Tax=Desulfofervidus auxilii TaxID=1621989 RepID=A0A7V0IA53_DESA2|nr:HEAT repeat domain-containing protein [Candidatus Desulfofervidus auxilii]